MNSPRNYSTLSIPQLRVEAAARDPKIPSAGRKKDDIIANLVKSNKGEFVAKARGRRAASVTSAPKFKTKLPVKFRAGFTYPRVDGVIKNLPSLRAIQNPMPSRNSLTRNYFTKAFPPDLFKKALSAPIKKNNPNEPKKKGILAWFDALSPKDQVNALLANPNLKGQLDLFRQTKSKPQPKGKGMLATYLALSESNKLKLMKSTNKDNKNYMNKILTLLALDKKAGKDINKFDPNINLNIPNSTLRRYKEELKGRYMDMEAIKNLARKRRIPSVADNKRRFTPLEIMQRIVRYNADPNGYTGRRTQVVLSQEERNQRRAALEQKQRDQARMKIQVNRNKARQFELDFAEEYGVSTRDRSNANIARNIQNTRDLVRGFSAKAKTTERIMREIKEQLIDKLESVGLGEIYNRDNSTNSDNNNNRNYTGETNNNSNNISQDPPKRRNGSNQDDNPVSGMLLYLAQSISIIQLLQDESRTTYMAKYSRTPEWSYEIARQRNWPSDRKQVSSSRRFLLMKKMVEIIDTLRRQLANTEERAKHLASYLNTIADFARPRHGVDLKELVFSIQVPLFNRGSTEKKKVTTLYEFLQSFTSVVEKIRERMVPEFETMPLHILPKVSEWGRKLDIDVQDIIRARRPARLQVARRNPQTIQLKPRVIKVIAKFAGIVRGDSPEERMKKLTALAEKLKWSNAPQNRGILPAVRTYIQQLRTHDGPNIGALRQAAGIRVGPRRINSTRLQNRKLKKFIFNHHPNRAKATPHPLIGQAIEYRKYLQSFM